ncbi:Uncharacterised protein [Vibrio cholerae]|nr:Uncharacterised protein [Vibrio cholerae]CSD10664.1 Uncharacterised protein [Vibrio cholerae]
MPFSKREKGSPMRSSSITDSGPFLHMYSMAFWSPI